MNVVLETSTATIRTSAGAVLQTLAVMDYTATLDEERTPYASLDLRAKLPAAYSDDDFSPYNDLRVTVQTERAIPAQLVYSTDFEADLDGWANINGANNTWSLFPATSHSGTHVLRQTQPATASNAPCAVRTLTGLVVGATYVIRAWCMRTTSGATTCYLGTNVAGDAGSARTTPALNVWTLLSHTFVATATSHNIYLGRGPRTTTTTVSWDDVTVTRYSPSTTRTFDLLLHESTTHEALNFVEIVAQGDEAPWLDVARTNDVPALTSLSGALNGLDAKTIFQHYLNTPPSGPAITLDPTFAHSTAALVNDKPTVFYKYQNLLPNPSFSANITGYFNGSCSIARDTGWSRVDVGSLRVHTPTSTSSYVDLGNTANIRFGMAAGSSYIFRGSMRVRSALSSAESDSARRLQIVWKDASGAYHTAQSEQADRTVGAVTDLEVRFTLPYGIVEAFPRLVFGHSSGEIQWDALMLISDDSLLGDTADTTLPDDIWYLDSAGNVIRKYQALSGAWAETNTYPNHTFSGGIMYYQPYSPDAQPAPDSPYWDVMERVMTASGQRLYCDELRRWRVRAIGSNTATTHDIAAGVIEARNLQSLQRDVNGKPLYADSIRATFRNYIGMPTVSRLQLGATAHRTWVVEIDLDRGTITQADADALALRMLQGVNRHSVSREVQAITNLALDPGDLVETGSGRDEVVSRVTFTSAGVTTLITRAPEAA